MFKIYRKFIGLILASAFVAVVFFGLNMGMDRRQNGDMSGCMFNQSATCPMDYQEHVNHRQEIFTATQPEQNAALTLLIMIVIGSAILPFFSFFKRRVHTLRMPCILQSILKQCEITAKLSDHILQDLSGGILNPKLYDSLEVIG